MLGNPISFYIPEQHLKTRRRATPSFHMSLLLLGTTELGKKLASNCDDTEEYLLFPTFFEQFTKVVTIFVTRYITKHPIGGNRQYVYLV